jgi:hypothetical protein
MPYVVEPDVLLPKPVYLQLLRPLSVHHQRMFTLGT